MAITAHWIEAKQNPTRLALRADLIGFIHIPGRHTGEHLAHSLLYALDRIHITEKVPLYFYILFMPVAALLI
jgi:hypothetical protein